MRVRQHVNPLKSEHLTIVQPRLELPAGREVEVEVGCADAQFLFARAERAPAAGRVYVGLEIRPEFVAWIHEQAAARGLPVRAVFANVNVDLEKLFAPASVTRVFVNFPDPWFKRRHRKRRVVDDGLARAIAGILAPGGELFFQSDVWDLALDALGVLEEHAGTLANRAGAWSFWKGGNPYGVTSRREDAVAAEGLAVWRMWYERR
jgi:tRNA (guanine-N7-)-methyltransferase